ncbi:hypothetical protein BTVI_40391 [Pitangus sulphuratus]|nr:hypothetical protein BTVI_40391 [Pitangus sulphuratus]
MRWSNLGRWTPELRDWPKRHSRVPSHGLQCQLAGSGVGAVPRGDIQHCLQEQAELKLWGYELRPKEEQLEKDRDQVDSWHELKLEKTIGVLKTSQNKMFAALQYHSTDYLYESMARQKFSIWRLSLCFPPCLYQDEKYHLTGLFTDDKYRKPWTRVTSTQNMVTISVLDQWKKSLPVEDFLEKKPISSVELQIGNELMEVIPSSNPCSQTDIEEHLLLMNKVFKEESTQEKYLKIYYVTEFKEPWQGIDEVVWVIANLSSCLRECLIFQNEMKMEESKNELQEIKENFCTIPIKEEEYFMLPIELEFNKLSNGRSDSAKIPSYLELKELLNLASDTLADEDLCKEVIKEYLKAEIAHQVEISKYCPIPQEVCSSNSTSMLEFCESGPSREYLESLVWQSEKYRDNMSSLLLVEHQAVNLVPQHHSLTELQEMLPVEIEAPMLSSLEKGWWLHLGLNLAATEILEQLHMDDSNANSLIPTEIEKFTRFTSYQLERWLEENSVTNQELLSAERHQLDKVVNPDLSLQTQRQYFGLPMSAASSPKICSTNTSGGELTGEINRRIKAEEAICFLNQEKKTPKPSESVSCKGVSSKVDSSCCGEKPGSLALAAKWDNDDSDLNNFIMMRSKHTLRQREEKNYVDRPEKVLQSEENHMRVHEEDDSVCEIVKTEEKTQENEDGITVNIQASESQCQAYCLLEDAAIPVLKDLTCLGVLASVNWSFDSVKFDHTRFFLKQQEKVVCDNFEQGYLSKAKDIYKNILESCLNNIWRQLKIVQYSSQKKHETNPKITALQCEMLNWMKSYGEKHSVKILIIIRMDSEREKTALIHLLSRVEGFHSFKAGLKAVDLNSEKKGILLACKDIISNLSRYSCIIVHNQQIGADFPWTHFSLVMEYDYSEDSCWRNLCKNLNVAYMTFKTTLPEAIQTGNHSDSFLLEVQIPYVFLTTEGLLNMPDILQLFESKYSLKGDTLLNLVLFYATLIELTQKSEEFEVKHFSDMMSSYNLNAAPLEKTVQGASQPEKQNNLNTICPDYKQSQALDLLDKALNSTGTTHMDSEALIPPLKLCKGFFKSDLPSCMQKNACSSDVITRRKQNFFAVSKGYEDFAHLDIPNSVCVQRQPFRIHDGSEPSSKDSEKEDFIATFNVCEPQENSKSFLEEFRDTFKSSEIQIDQAPWNDSSSTGLCNSFACDGFLSDFFVDTDKLQNLNFNQTDSGFPEVAEFKKKRLTYERVPGRSDGQTRLKFF